MLDYQAPGQLYQSKMMLPPCTFLILTLQKKILYTMCSIEDHCIFHRPYR